MKTPKLKFKKVTYYELDYKELEHFVQKVYGFKKYNFVFSEECGNDCSITFKVTGQPDEYTAEQIDSWKSDDTHSNYWIMDKLCKDGYIPKGKYLVKVCW